MRKREILSKIKNMVEGERLQIVKTGQHRYHAYCMIAYEVVLEERAK